MRVAQYDSRYECLSDIDLVYDQTESLITINGVEGLPVVKDREYCELLHLSDSTEKYECIKTIAVVNQDNTLTTACSSESDPATCKTEKKTALRKLNLIQELGGDYCYITYFWED